MFESIFTLEEETRKKEIINTSLKIIDKRGIKGLTVARIAEEVGFAESALYRHFKSKKEIISFILEEVHKLSQSNFFEIKKSVKNPVEELRLLLKIHFEFLEQYPGLFKIIYSDELHIGESSLLEKLQLVLNEIIKSIEDIVKRGKKEKIFRPDLDTTIAAVHFLGIVQTAFSYWTIGGRRISLLQTGDKLISQFFSGISA
jgi:AcrR family transcriptional regulator